MVPPFRRRPFCSRWLVPILLPLWALTTAAVAQPEPPATGTILIVDFQAALRESEAFAAVEREAERLRDVFRAEFAVLERELREVERQLGAERDDVPPEEFNARRRAFEERVVEAQRAAQERRAALDRATRTATDRIRDRLIEIVSVIARDRGATLVLERETVVLVSVDLDITDMAIERLNAALPTVPVDMGEVGAPAPGDVEAPQPPGTPPPG